MFIFIKIKLIDVRLLLNIFTDAQVNKKIQNNTVFGIL